MIIVPNTKNKKTLNNLQRLEERFAKIHGDKYDYTYTFVTSMKGKLCITCKIHGDFYQNIGDHLTGNGCKVCGKIRAREKLYITTEEFISRATSVHKDKYDYSKTVYAGDNTNVIIICSEHGEFLQTPASHVRGKSGCRKCSMIANGIKRALGIDEFIARSYASHDIVYDYSLIPINVTSKDVVSIICPSHGLFKQGSQSHYTGANCPQCVIEFTSLAKRNSYEYFIEKAQYHHKNTYDYSNVVYTNWTDEITIICSKHGQFNQKANIHAYGSGCQRCSKEKSEFIFSERLKNLPTMLYYIKITNTKGVSLYKIGITCNDVYKRYKSELEQGYYIEILNTEIFNNRFDAFYKEQLIIESSKKYKYYGERFLTSGGDTELFVSDVLKINQ